jgi:L-rhamnose mutarotase
MPTLNRQLKYGFQERHQTVFSLSSFQQFGSLCDIRNYSIFPKEPENILFGYWEYHGADFAVGAARMAADSRTQQWWKICEPCQVPFETRKADEWWSPMEEVFHHD